ncbi:MAG: aminomethyltransferase [Candidatus Tectimicrobiota bacterium]|nr:MAG: aminomethyltransferase [Candidatus Tectomicrobia bacterium]
MRRSPLFSTFQALGATFTTVADWEVPLHFGDPQVEYWAVRQQAGLADLSHRGLVRVTGSDRQRFLHAMVTNDIAGLRPGEGCYAAFLTNKGKMIADFVVYATPEAYLLDLEPQLVEPFCQAIEAFVIADDVVFEDVSAQWGLLSLQGPQAAACLEQAAGAALPALPPYGHELWHLGSHTVRLIRRSHTGEEGYQLLLPMATLGEVWEALWAHRQVCGLRPVGLHALEVLRIEAGLPLAGRELTPDTLPLEANLLAAISFTKGCYVGQEVIARVTSRGHVNRQLVGLLLARGPLPPSGAKVVSPQREVGWVTSAAYSPALQQPVALAYVRREVSAPGQPLAVVVDGESVPATVAELPLYRGTRQEHPLEKR